MTGVLETATLFTWCGAGLIGIGLYGLVAQPHLLRRLIGFNIVGSGVFLVFGASSARPSSDHPDPVPMAMILTGIVVALATTALLVALVVRYAELTGQATLPEERSTKDDPG